MANHPQEGKKPQGREKIPVKLGINGLGRIGKLTVWHPEAVVSPKMGREEAPRLLRRKDAFIFLPCLRPAEAALAHHPGPRATSWWWPSGQGIRISSGMILAKCHPAYLR